MKSAVIRFPGSNCERDAFTVLEQQDMHPSWVWHDATELPGGTDLVVIPGGFTYGDYLRVGAMAANAPVMRAVTDFAEKGGHVLGICNGFQILCETHLLPGTLMKNDHLQFTCKEVHLRVEHTDSAYTSSYDPRAIITIPIAHLEGNFFADEDELKAMNDNNQILFRYCDEEGLSTNEANPNGSTQHIAGITNAKGNVLGMMPHPERHAEPALGGIAGAGVFASLKKVLG